MFSDIEVSRYLLVFSLLFWLMYLRIVIQRYNNMLKIATHNSCTGEKGKGLLSFLVTPFARCQGKKIYEQFRAGCRLFDIRATVCRDGQYRPAHGLWTCRRTIPEILAELDMLAATDAEHPTYITMTYEHVNNYQAGFISEVKGWMGKFPHIHFVEIAVKKPTWTVLKGFETVPSKSDFIALNRKHWQMWLPIPWLWKKIYFPTPSFNEDEFTYVDFL